MTDKQIIMKEITECGFYCSKDDTERLYIYEVIKNTDEEWLKENPEATLLIDEWIYDYTDYDDRKVYKTGGNLTVVCNDSAKCKVYKIEDTKYKIYGNCGHFLIEDKPTYKEQLNQLKAELEQEKALKETYLACYKTKHEELANKYETLKARYKSLEEISGRLQEQNHNLTLENEKLEVYRSITPINVEELVQTLTEIKEIAKPRTHYIDINQNKTAMELEYNYANIVWNLEQRMYKILQKISEVIDEEV